MKAVPIDLFATARTQAIPGAASDNPMSVCDLALRTREVVESRLKAVWVRGEISDFKKHRNGHWYFCLRDRSAQIRCVVWAGDQYRMPATPLGVMALLAEYQIPLDGARAVVVGRSTIVGKPVAHLLLQANATV
ncbi:MAG: exodeoxyribonuclease VII large subunit, partial [Gaiellaceae bacterium]